VSDILVPMEISISIGDLDPWATESLDQSLQAGVEDDFASSRHGASPILRDRAARPRHGASPILRRRAAESRNRPESGDSPGTFHGPTSGFGAEVGKSTGLRADNPADRTKIDAYMKEAGIPQSSANIAWCAAFLNAELAHEGVQGSGGLSVDSFRRWGRAESAKEAKAGDVMIVYGGAHVGRFTGDIDPKTGRYGFYSGNAEEPNEPAPNPGRSQWGGVREQWLDPNGVVFRAPTDRETYHAAALNAAGASPSVTASSSSTSSTWEPAAGANVPMGMGNRNPANIKYNPALPGVVGPSKNTDQGDPQSVFESSQAGMNAAHGLALRKYNRGMRTADQIIAGPGGWTPGNHQAAANVAASMGIRPGDDLNFSDPSMRQRFLHALVKQEQGPSSSQYPDEMYTNAVGGN
jgi:hypothetical protein